MSNIKFFAKIELITHTCKCLFTSLQKDCNTHYDLTAEKTLSIAQSLYEKKLISYPRTGSRHIPEDVMRIIPSLLEKITSIPDFKAYGESFDLSDLNTRTPK